jgi:hypothetical protein
MSQLKAKGRLLDHRSDDLAGYDDFNTTNSQGEPNRRPGDPAGTDESPPYVSPPPPWPRVFPQL